MQKALKWVKRRIKSFCGNLFAFVMMLPKLLQMLPLQSLRELPKLKLSKVLIVGNGPSAAQTDLYAAKAAGYDLLCVNLFAVNREDFLQLKPRYYCAIDPEIYAPGGASMLDALRALLERVDWPLTYICFPGQNPRVQNPCVKMVTIAENSYRGAWLRYPLYRHNLASLPLINVVGAALHFCLTGRADAVCLTGVESDWHRELVVDRNNIVYRDDTHFYGTERVLETGVSIAPGELYRYFEFYSITLRGFYDASRYAAAQKIDVYNLTPHSYIDVFQKRDATEVFAEDA